MHFSLQFEVKKPSSTDWQSLTPFHQSTRKVTALYYDTPMFRKKKTPDDLHASDWVKVKVKIGKIL